MNSQQLINFQDSGEATSLNDANEKISAARATTPSAIRKQFSSRITREDGVYVWWWILK